MSTVLPGARALLLLVAAMALPVNASSAGCKSAQKREQGAGPEKPGDQGHGHGEHHDEHGHDKLPRKVRLRPEVVRDAQIRTAPVRREVLEQTVNLPGEIVADPDRMANVASPVAGRIEKVHFGEGSQVKAGDLLAEIRIPELGTLRGDLSAAQARARAARSRADQLRALVKDRLAAEQVYRDAEANAEALETGARALQTQLGALGAGRSGGPSLLPVRSPLTGVVIKRQAVMGQPLGKEEVLAVVADLSQVWFIGRVFEKDLGRLATGSAAEVQLNAYPDRRLAGKVTYLGRQIDPVARTVTARIPLEKADDILRLGLFGTARVVSAGSKERRPSLAVPRTALTEINRKPVVFVEHKEGEYQIHEVVVGDESVGKVEVLSGLREGEQVVVEGAFTLKSIILKSTLDDDHH